jgi:hypothetical protein
MLSKLYVGLFLIASLFAMAGLGLFTLALITDGIRLVAPT